MLHSVNPRPLSYVGLSAWQGHIRGINPGSYLLPCGRRIISGSDDDTINVLDADTDVAVGKSLVCGLRLSLSTGCSPPLPRTRPFAIDHYYAANSVSMLSSGLRAHIPSGPSRPAVPPLPYVPLTPARRSTLQ